MPSPLNYFIVCSRMSFSISSPVIIAPKIMQLATQIAILPPNVGSANITAPTKPTTRYIAVISVSRKIDVLYLLAYFMFAFWAALTFAICWFSCFFCSSSYCSCSLSILAIKFALLSGFFLLNDFKRLAIYHFFI